MPSVLGVRSSVVVRPVMVVCVSGTTFLVLEWSSPGMSLDVSPVPVCGSLCSRMPSAWLRDSVVRRSMSEVGFRKSEVRFVSCVFRLASSGRLVAAEADGDLVLRKLPMRERDASLRVCRSLLDMRVCAEEPDICGLEVPAWPSRATPDFAAVGADGLVMPMVVPMCLPESVLVESGCVVVSLPDLDSEGVLAVMELPIRDVMLRLIRPFDAALELLLGLDLEGPGVIELPILEVRPEPWLGAETTGEEPLDPLLRLGAEGVLPVTELPIREVMLRFIPLLRPVPGELPGFDMDGVLVVIELPIPEVRPELMRPEELLFEGPREIDGDALRVLTDDPMLGDLEDAEGVPTETGARDVMDGLETLLPKLREFSMLEREDIDGLGATVRAELLRPDEITGRELAGG